MVRMSLLSRLQPTSGSSPVVMVTWVTKLCCLQMEKFIRRKLAVCKWVGLGALVVQVSAFSVLSRLTSVRQTTAVAVGVVMMIMIVLIVVMVVGVLLCKRD